MRSLRWLKVRSIHFRENNKEHIISTEDELAMHPAESSNLAARHKLVEIVEACRREADVATLECLRHVTTSRYARQLSIKRYAIRLRLLHSVAPLLRSVPTPDGFATWSRYSHPPPAT